MFGLVKLIKGVLNAVAEITAWVLLKFHLWVPAAFAVVFIMVCAVGGHSPVDYSDIFFGGIGLSIVASIVLMLLTARTKSNGLGLKSKKKDPPPKRIILEEHISIERHPSQTVEPQPPQKPTLSIAQSLNKYIDPPTEEPMIFASRKDPDILIYEYSTRIEVYQRRGSRVKLVEVIEKR